MRRFSRQWSPYFECQFEFPLKDDDDDDDGGGKTEEETVPTHPLRDLAEVEFTDKSIFLGNLL